jgi:hypothetical protein
LLHYYCLLKSFLLYWYFLPIALLLHWYFQPFSLPSNCTDILTVQMFLTELLFTALICPTGLLDMSCLTPSSRTFLVLQGTPPPLQQPVVFFQDIQFGPPTPTMPSPINNSNGGFASPNMNLHTATMSDGNGGGGAAAAAEHMREEQVSICREDDMGKLANHAGKHHGPAVAATAAPQKLSFSEHVIELRRQGSKEEGYAALDTEEGDEQQGAPPVTAARYGHTFKMDDMGMVLPSQGGAEGSGGPPSLMTHLDQSTEDSCGPSSLVPDGPPRMAVRFNDDSAIVRPKESTQFDSLKIERPRSAGCTRSTRTVVSRANVTASTPFTRWQQNQHANQNQNQASKQKPARPGSAARPGSEVHVASVYNHQRIQVNAASVSRPTSQPSHAYIKRGKGWQRRKGIRGRRIQS